MITLESVTFYLYPIFLLAGWGMIHCVFVLMSTARRRDQSTRNDRTPYLLIVFTSLITLFVCFESLFLRFRGLELLPEGIELVYAWPRPRVIVSSQSFQRVEVLRDLKKNGHMVLVTKNGTFRSVSFSRAVNAEAVKTSLDSWVISAR